MHRRTLPRTGAVAGVPGRALPEHGAAQQTPSIGVSNGTPLGENAMNITLYLRLRVRCCC